jgi:hypothetical protein
VKRTRSPFEESGAGAALGGMGDRHGCRPDECPGEFGRALNGRLEQFPVEIRREIADDSGNGTGEAAEGGRQSAGFVEKVSRTLEARVALGRTWILPGSQAARREVIGDALGNRTDHAGGAHKWRSSART